MGVFERADQPDALDQAEVGDADRPQEMADTPRTTDLARDVEVERGDLEYDRKVREAHVRTLAAEAGRLEQVNTMRSRFAWFAVIIVAMCVLASVVFVGYQTFTGKVTDAVLIALVSGLAVEALGVTAIVANYLFRHPDDTGPKK